MKKKDIELVEKAYENVKVNNQGKTFSMQQILALFREAGFFVSSPWKFFYVKYGVINQVSWGKYTFPAKSPDIRLFVNDMREKKKLYAPPHRPIHRLSEKACKEFLKKKGYLIYKSV